MVLGFKIRLVNAIGFRDWFHPNTSLPNLFDFQVNRSIKDRNFHNVDQEDNDNCPVTWGHPACMWNIPATVQTSDGAGPGNPTRSARIVGFAFCRFMEQ